MRVDLVGENWLPWLSVDNFIDCAELAHVASAGVAVGYLVDEGHASAVAGGGWRHVVAEFGQFGGDDVLTPQRVFGPHPADERSGVRVDGRSPDWSPRSSTPDQVPQGAVPANHGVGANNGDGSDERREQLGDGADGEAVAGLEARVGRGPIEQDHLLAEEGVLGQENATRAEQVAERGKKGFHGFTEHRARVPTDDEHGNLHPNAVRRYPGLRPAVEEKPLPLLPTSLLFYWHRDHRENPALLTFSWMAENAEGRQFSDGERAAGRSRRVIERVRTKV